MTDREARLESARNVCAAVGKTYRHLRAPMEVVVATLNAEADARDGFAPEDALPADGVDVLVYASGDYRVARRSEGRWWNRANGMLIYAGLVLRWWPMPPEPESVTDAQRAAGGE